MKNKRITLNSYDLSEDLLFELLPDNFYKYIGISDYLKDNLSNSQLWYNSPNSFNDPFDCKAHINFGATTEECTVNFEKFKKYFDNSISDEERGFTEEQARAVWNHLLQTPENFNLIQSAAAASSFEEWLGVTCFSENPNNTLMWSHYADNHRGVVLEFTKKRDGLLGPKLLPVQYFETYPVINVGDYKTEQMLAIAYQVIVAKGVDWAYEEEWRVITQNGASLNKFKKEELSAIIFGLSTPDDQKKEIYNLVLNSGYQDVRFKEAQFIHNKFIVEYVNYDPNS